MEELSISTLEGFHLLVKVVVSPDGWNGNEQAEGGW